MSYLIHCDCIKGKSTQIIHFHHDVLQSIHKLKAQKATEWQEGIRLRVMMPLSTIFQLFRGGQYLLVEETRVLGGKPKTS